MKEKFFLCARAMRKNTFIPEPGPTRYLKVPEGKMPGPGHAVSKGQWIKDLRKAAIWGKDSRDKHRDRGDLLVFVHGYNNDLEIINKRHEQLEKDLAGIGFKGKLMTFCWPSDDMALNYLEDRHDAKRSAMQLVSDGIAILSAQQTPGCAVNIHLIGHSTGAYVIREAFDDADDAALPNNAWSVSQVVFIAADMSSDSMSDGNPTTESLYRHCRRLTNYHNRYDSVLKLSNAKRIGMAPRTGRIGLPVNAPDKAVDIDCSAYFQTMNSDNNIRKQDQAVELGSFEHSWHIGNRVFTEDLFELLKGDLDREVFPTRRPGPDGRFALARPDLG